MTFHGDSGVAPDPAPRQVGGKLVAGGSLVTNNPGSLKPDSGDPETETGNLETDKRVQRIHDTLETGLHMMPRSLMAPSRGAGGFLRYSFVEPILAQIRFHRSVGLDKKITDISEPPVLLVIQDTPRK